MHDYFVCVCVLHFFCELMRTLNFFVIFYKKICCLSPHSPMTMTFTIQVLKLLDYFTPFTYYRELNDQLSTLNELNNKFKQDKINLCHRTIFY